MHFGSTFRARNHVRRWAVVAVVIVFFALLGELSYFSGGVTPQLGLDAEWRDGSLVVIDVQPAGLAWMDGVRRGDVVQEVDGVPVERGQDASTVADATSVSVVNSPSDRRTPRNNAVSRNSVSSARSGAV